MYFTSTIHAQPGLLELFWSRSDNERAVRNKESHEDALLGVEKTSGEFLAPLAPRPASYCHGIVSVVHLAVRLCVCPCIRLCVRKLFLQKTSQKLLTGFLRNFTGMFLRCSSFKFLQIIVFYEEFWLPWRSK